MDAGKTNLLKFMRLDHQLSVPIYQRKYSWTNKECEQLFNDVLRVGLDSNEQNHFIGSICYMNEDGHISKLIDELMLIDGQQRITTISLLISAIADYLINNPNNKFEYPLLDNPQKLIDYYLLNDIGNENSKYKLILTNEDKTTLIKILNNLKFNETVDFNDDDSVRIHENYTFFRNKVNVDNIEYIFKGLEKLLIIYVALEHNIDNPQLIFESLNSTGLELSQADLIRNYILMGLSPYEQEKLYNNYWYKIEKLFKDYNSEVFDKFIRDYLTVKTDKVPTFKNIYFDFKLYSKTFDNIEVLVKDVFKFAQYLSCISQGKEKNEKLKKALDSLESLGYDVTYPYMLHLYQDYEKGKLSGDEFIKIIKYTESYLLRRLICNIPTPSLNKTFAKMYNDIDTENYLESYKVVLLLKENYQRMPNNEEFRRNFLERDIYNLRGKNKEYIFDKLENWNSKEKTPIQNYTIEHIMPQNLNLSDEWINDLGPNYEEIQSKYLHTIGNLTLTGYNSKLSDKSFKEKRDIIGGFRQSAIRLNIGLHDLEVWNEGEIQKRAENILEDAYKIWEYPIVSNETLEHYKSKKVS